MSDVDVCKASHDTQIMWVLFMNAAIFGQLVINLCIESHLTELASIQDYRYYFVTLVGRIE